MIIIPKLRSNTSGVLRVCNFSWKIRVFSFYHQSDCRLYSPLIPNRFKHQQNHSIQNRIRELLLTESMKYIQFGWQSTIYNPRSRSVINSLLTWGIINHTRLPTLPARQPKVEKITSSAFDVYECVNIPLPW